MLCEGSIATSAAKTGYNKFRAAARLMQLYVKAAPHGRNGEGKRRDFVLIVIHTILVLSICDEVEDEDNKTNIDKAVRILSNVNHLILNSFP